VIFTGETRLDCAEQMFKWKKRAETQTNKQLKAIRINNTSKLESCALKWTRELEVEYQSIVLYTSS
jgi:hypothetical protein